MIFGLEVIILFFSSLQIGTSYNVKDFGCKNYVIRGHSSDKPVYGTEIGALLLQNEAKLEELMHVLKEFNKRIIETMRYNSVDTLLDFYNKAKHNRPYTKEFLEKYVPKFQDRSPAFGVPLYILNRLVSELEERWSTIKQNVFLAAVQTDVHIKPKDFKNLVNSYLDTEPGKIIDRSIAVLKFALGGRLGHILFETLPTLTFPTVIMQDNGEPLKYSTFFNSNGKEMVYRVSNTSKNFITFAEDKQIPQTCCNKTEKYLHFDKIIYVGRPFCSGLDTSVKLELLEQEKYLLRFYDSGLSSFGMTFSLEPFAKNHQDVKVNSFRIFTDFGVDHKMEKYIKFTRLRPNASKPVQEDEMSFINSVNNMLGLDEYVLYDKMERVAEMMMDQMFVLFMRDYAKAFYEKLAECDIRTSSLSFAKYFKNVFPFCNKF